MELYMQLIDYRDLKMAILFRLKDMEDRILKKYHISQDILKYKIKKGHIEIIRKNGEKIKIYPKPIL